MYFLKFLAMWEVQGFTNKPRECHGGFWKLTMWNTSVSTWKMSSLLIAGPVRDSSWNFSPFEGFWWFCDASVPLVPRALVLYSIRMRSIIFFCSFPCTHVLFCCSAVLQQLLTWLHCEVDLFPLWFLKAILLPWSISQCCPMPSAKLRRQHFSFWRQHKARSDWEKMGGEKNL